MLWLRFEQRLIDKNKILKAERGITFEHVTIAIENDGLLDVLQHPNTNRYPNQKILVVQCHGYVHLVPFIEEYEHFFLKTIIPSRKATRDYLKRRAR